MALKLYVASSWKNPFYGATTAFLKDCGHEIMDWQKDGFSWQQVTPIKPEHWEGEFYRDTVLRTPRAQEGFKNDMALMASADACVLLLPCGRSAHLEAGIMIGHHRPTFVYMPVFDGPDLMYLAATAICFTLPELKKALEQ